MLTFLGIEPHGLERCDYSSRIVDEEALAAARDQKPFASEAQAVLAELVQSVKLIARVRWVDETGEPRPLARDEAILAGQMVRLAKLHHGLLRFCEPPEMELFGFLLRGVVETAVNLRFLVEHGTPDIYEAFVRDSLRLDKELHDRINAKVMARGGTVMPMEYGMLEGVEEAFRVAGVELDSVDANARFGWTKGGVFGRFKAIDLEELYAPYFAVQSNYAHGGWQELNNHHLTVQPDGRFLPKADFEGLLAPSLIMAVDVIAGASVDYLRAAGPECDDRDVLQDRVSFCGEKNHLIRQAYRSFRGMPDLPNPL